MRKALRAAAVLALTSCGNRSTDANTSLPRSRSTNIALSTEPRALASFLGVPPESLRAAGEERYQRQAYDSAAAIFRVEVTRAAAAHDGTAEARAHMWLGLAAWRLGRYQLAREEGERSLAMKRRLGLDDELSRSYNALGLLAWNEGRELEAVRDFDSAVATARRVGDLAGVARASANLPLVQVELGNYDATRDDLALALTAANKLGDAKLVGNALVNLAMLNIRLGKAAAALPLLDEARKHYDTVGYKTGESNALGQRATAWSELGDLARAEASADTALTIARSQGLEQEVAGLLEVEADLREQAGNPRAALQTLIEADSLDSAMGLTVERGINLRRTGAILLDLGEAAAALSRARSALAIHDAAHERGEVVYDRVLLALAMSRTGDLRAASVPAYHMCHD